MQQEPSTNALPITGLEIPNVDFELPLAGVVPHCQYYDDAYFKAAGLAEIPEVGALFRSLGILCSFFPQYWNRAEPYRAAMIWDTRRSSIPDDLTEADVDTIEKLLPIAKDVVLRARLADILWLRRKSAHQAARESIDDYLAAAQGLLQPEHWGRSVDLFHRALQLAGKLGREKAEFAKAETALFNALEHPLSKTEPFFANHFLHLILALGLGDAQAMADIAKLHAELPLIGNDPDRRRGYLLLEADFRQAQGDTVREAEARLLAAETYVEEAEDCAKRQPPSYLGASGALAQGIEALRQAHAPSGRITELKGILKDYQKRSMSEMHTYRVPVDTREACAASVDYVTNNDFRRSMILFAMGVDVVSFEELKKDVLESVNYAPFTFLGKESMLDEAGRVVAHKESLLGLTGEAAEQELEKRMFDHARNYIWKWRAETFIEPARQQIWRQHQPRLRNLEYLVRHNPFIPPGHEGIFLQGLYYGLAGDFMIASHLLAPQIENSMRYVLEQNGADVSNLNSDLTQQVKTLGALFDMPEAMHIFRKDLCFEMRGLLKERHGYSFRNDIAHGFVTQGDCYGVAALNTWWLTLKLCHCTMNLPDDRSEGAITEDA